MLIRKTLSRKILLKLVVLLAQRCWFRVRWWEHRTEKRLVCGFVIFREGTGDISWICVGFPSVTATRKAAFHWKSPLLLHVAQQSSLCSHCQKGLRTFYPLHMQLSQDIDWPLTFCKKFPHMFASPKFLRMWLLCFVFAVGSFPYFLVRDWEQVMKVLHRSQGMCSSVFQH